MDSSYLQTLPRELRDAIWQLTLQLQDEVYIFDEDDKPHVDESVAEQNPLALTETCQQIRTECHSVFYRNNSFRLESSILTQPYQLSACKTPGESGFKTFKVWIDQIGPDCSSALKAINISLSELHHTYVAEDDVWPRSWPIEELTEFMGSEQTKNVAWALSFVAHAWPPRAPLPVNIEFDNIKLDAPFRAIERALTDRNDGYDIAMKEGKLQMEAHATYHDAVKQCGGRAKRFVSVVRDRHREKVKLNQMKGKMGDLRCA